MLLPLLQERVGERLKVGERLQLQERAGERLKVGERHQGRGEAPKKPRTMCNRAGLDCYSIRRKRGVTC